MYVSQSLAYFTIKAGGTKVSDVSDTFKGTNGTATFSVNYHLGANFSLAGGWRLNRNARVEIELGGHHLNADNIKGSNSLGISSDIPVKDEDIGVVSKMMLNGYYDVATRSRFVPYVGAGIGSAAAAHRYHKDDHGATKAFAYQFLAGVNFKASKSVLILLEYSFFGTSKGTFLKFPSPGGVLDFKDSIHANSLSLGVTFFA